MSKAALEARGVSFVAASNVRGRASFRPRWSVTVDGRVIEIAIEDTADDHAHVDDDLLRADLLPEDLPQRLSISAPFNDAVDSAAVDSISRYLEQQLAGRLRIPPRK